MTILKHLSGVIFVAFVLSLALDTTAQAIEELKVYRGVLLIEGKIVPGDYDKFRNFLGNRSNFDKISNGVFLASPGGSINDAMRMGRLIRALRLSTDAPSGSPTGSPKFGQSVITPNNLVDQKANYLCTSACFLVYVGGAYRYPTWAGRLGVHRPVQLESNAKKLDVDQTLNLNWRIRQMVKNYLVEMDVPEKYVDLIYSVSPNELHLITQNEFDSDLKGFSPKLKQLIGAKCGQGPMNQSDEAAQCWMRQKKELSNEGWDKVFLGR